MAKHQHLHVFGRTGTGEESQPAADVAAHEVDEAKRYASWWMPTGMAETLHLPTSTVVTDFWNPAGDRGHWTATWAL